MTVLFCDLVGSTSLGDRADRERLRELMVRYHGELRSIIERIVLLYAGFVQPGSKDALDTAARRLQTAATSRGEDVRRPPVRLIRDREA